FVNVPIGAMAVAAAVVFLTEGRRPTESKSLDVAGAVTVTAGLAALVYAIVNTNSVGWASARTIGWLAGAVALLVVFLVIQTRARSPLMPLSLFRSRT